jgi:hypothetical protein
LVGMVVVYSTAEVDRGNRLIFDRNLTDGQCLNQSSGFISSFILRSLSLHSQIQPR